MGFRFLDSTAAQTRSLWVKTYPFVFSLLFFFFPFRVLITGSLHTAARHIPPQLSFAWKTNIGVTSPPLYFNVFFFLFSFFFYKERPWAKEIRWGHGCFAGLQIVCRKVEFVANWGEAAAHHSWLRHAGGKYSINTRAFTDDMYHKCVAAVEEGGILFSPQAQTRRVQIRTEMRWIDELVATQELRFDRICYNQARRRSWKLEPKTDKTAKSEQILGHRSNSVAP